MKTDWWTCDGGGSTRPESRTFSNSLGVSRRNLLVGAGLGLVGWTSVKSALANVTVSPDGKDRNVFVYVFLRGGADGLNIVVPHAEDAYYRARPTLAIGRPKDGKVVARARALDLDGFYGLHPALSPLQELYHDGKMAVLHACGSDDHTRSHFEAMSAVERGAAHEGVGPASGWLARHLNSTESTTDSPLRAISFSETVPESLRGATHAMALTSLNDFKLQGTAGYQEKLRRLYNVGRDEVSHAGQLTMKAVDALNQLDPQHYKATTGVEYPTSDLGQGMKQAACLIKGKVGVETLCLDKGGWDTHVAQGADIGWQALLLQDVGQSLAAFVKDLGPEINRVTIVVMSEFGRRVAENGGFGTDHGRAGAMFVLGGNVKGGKVYAKWPGLEAHQLDKVGDLRVTTDYRSVLGEILTKRMGNTKLSEVFPNYSGSQVGLF